ncbi:Hypothetical predicted protein, partial [Podarcis lilfordi]
NFGIRLLVSLPAAHYKEDRHTGKPYLHIAVKAARQRSLFLSVRPLGATVYGATVTLRCFQLCFLTFALIAGAGGAR